ncbi:rsbT co-antagonist protein RsbR [Geomicrobium halophilum]|uniref:RsbT co-antagonist protein RsbR n=1 Tax=Geomicrobium halophilum TaxID=549000 RepID=A0A841PX99_9BACL|nr:STAS domain-containing protein [Geomicrobium halophilum]MBB6451271.1 rsbT co-antagonist protein RsbR [Geomicrobium halophilum]
MHSSVVDFIYQNKDIYIKKWRSTLDELDLNIYHSSISNEIIEETKAEFIDLVFGTLYTGEGEVAARFRRFADRLIYYHIPLSEFIRSLQLLRRVIMHDLEEQSTKEQYDRYNVDLEDWLDENINKLVDEFSNARENTVNLQNTALKELSAPLIPVFDKICVMPLVGTVDTERAKQIMESLLDGIIQHRAQVVLIDITGVPVVDTMVAHHIIKASQAVQLVGAECILVGIRPEIAQTIVNLGIDLSKIITKSTLQKGVYTALQMTRREIITLDEQRSTEV